MMVKGVHLKFHTLEAVIIYEYLCLRQYIINDNETVVIQLISETIKETFRMEPVKTLLQQLFGRLYRTVETYHVDIYDLFYVMEAFIYSSRISTQSKFIQ
jgi:hypothetical protein